MKPFSQRWMLPRVLGERRSGIGGGGSKALPAGQRAPVPPAAGLGGQEGKCSPSSTPGGSLGRERRNRGAGFSQQPSPGLGRQGTREDAGVYANYPWLGGKPKVAAGSFRETGWSRTTPVFTPVCFLVGAHLGFPGVALSWARLPGRCHRTLQRCARQINRVQSASSWSRTPPHPAHPAAVESNPGNDQKRRRGFMGHSKGPTGVQLCQTHWSAPGPSRPRSSSPAGRRDPAAEEPTIPGGSGKGWGARAPLQAEGHGHAVFRPHLPGPADCARRIPAAPAAPSSRCSLVSSLWASENYTLSTSLGVPVPGTRGGGRRGRAEGGGT